MSNSDYKETYHKIKKVKESNISFLNTMIQCVTLFTGKVDKLITNLQKVSNELPTKKQKKKSMFFKAEVDDRYEVIDQEFTPTWSAITSDFVNIHLGTQELNNAMKMFFIERIKLLIDSYSESCSSMETTFQNAIVTFDAAKDKYTKAIHSYTSLNNKIEQLNDKLKPENTNGKNPEYIEKLQSQLSDAKGDLPTAEFQAAEATAAFNEANLTFSITAEKQLSQFERIDQEHEKQLRAIFADFFSKYPGMADLHLNAANKIKSIADPSSVSEQSFNNDDINQEAVVVAPKFQLPSFDISTFVDPSEIFNTELVQSMATVVSNDIPCFPQGSLVVVTSDNSKEVTIADVISLKSAVVKKTDIQIENLRRTIAQLKEDFTVLTDDYQFEWKANEYLLVTPHKSLTGQTVWCSDMYGRSGEVPFNKLNTK